jgi:HEAT repeat protein
MNTFLDNRYTNRFLISFFTMILGVHAWIGSAQSIPRASSRASAGDSLVYKWKPGKQWIFKLNYSSVSSSDFTVLFDDNDSTTARVQTTPLAYAFAALLRGRWSCTVIRTHGDSVDVMYRLIQGTLQLSVNSVSDEDKAAEIEKNLHTDIQATQLKNGRIAAVWFDSTVSKVSQHFIRTLLASLQCVLPETSGLGATTWQTIEDDPNGRFQARYDMISRTGSRKGKQASSSSPSFRKSKTAYVSSKQKSSRQKKELLQLVKPSGTLNIRWNKRDGIIHSMEGAERQNIYVNMRQVGKASNTIHLQYLSARMLGNAEREQLSDERNAHIRTAQQVSLSETESAQHIQKTIQKAELGNATFDSLLTELFKVEQARIKGEKYNDTRIYLKFYALIYLHPEVCGTIGTLLSNADPSSVTRSVLAGALSRIGHKEAQEALMVAIKAKRDDPKSVFALILPLREIPEPTQQLVDFVQELAFHSTLWQISSAAQLALGSMARNLADIAPVRSDKIVQPFLHMLDTSVSLSVRRQCLLVLGNAGTIHAMPAILRRASDTLAEIRAVAASALRWIEQPRADSMLCALLVADKDSAVRMEAAIALGYRDMNEAVLTIEAITYHKEPCAGIRLQILNNLWKGRERLPSLPSLILEIADNDQFEKLRNAAKDFIEGYPGYFK